MTSGADVATYIAAVTDRRSRRLLLTGEPGIGKSTLVRTAVLDLTAAGFLVMQATPAFAERYTAYSMLWDLLSEIDCASTMLPAEHRAFLQIALGRQPASGELPSLGAAIALEGLLAALSARTPLALVVDDLQWADPESLATVERALRRLSSHPVYLVAASREYRGSIGAVHLAFDQRDVYALDGLSVEELESVTRTAWPSTTTRAQVVALHEHTGGNPMWALELIARGEISALGAMAVGTVDAPVSLAVAVADRLGTLSADAADVVSTVALLGHPELDLLDRVLRFGGITAVAADEAEAAGFLTVTTQTVRTRHPLQASAASSRLSPARRRQLHRFIASAVQDPVVKAQHLQQSQPTGPDEEIARSLASASVVMRQRGARLRSAHFAAQAVDRTDPGSPHYQDRVLDQAQHLFSAGDLAACLRALGRLSRERLDPHRYDALLALSTSSLAASRGHAATHTFLESQHQEAQAHGDAARLAIVRANQALDDLLTVALRGRMSAASFDALEGVDAPNAVHRALRGAIRSQLDAGHGLAEELIADSTRRQGIQIVVGLDDTGLAATGHHAHLVDDVSSSRLALEQLVLWARSEGKEGIERTFLASAAHVELTGGDVVAARLLARRSGHSASSAMSGTSPPVVLPMIGLLLLAGARHDELRAMTAAWAQADTGTGLHSQLHIPALLGFSAAARGGWPVAVEHLRFAADRADSLGLVELGSRFRVDLALVEALFHTGETVEARRRLGSVRSFLDGRDRPISRIGLHRMAALERAAAGDLSGALVEAGIAVDLSVDAARPADEAVSRVQRARVLMRMRKITLARHDLQVAGDRATASGHIGVRRVVDTAVATSRTKRSPTELTAAERRVLDVLRIGQSNKEIAAGLFISTRTVESHVAAILRKTGAASRSKLITQGR